MALCAKSTRLSNTRFTNAIYAKSSAKHLLTKSMVLGFTVKHAIHVLILALQFVERRQDESAFAFTSSNANMRRRVW